MRHTNSIEPKATAEGNDAVADEGLLRGTGGGFGPLFRKFPFEQRTLFHVLRHQAEQIPDKPWLIFDDTDVLTFQEGYARACQFAHAMRTVVDEPNRVALLLRNQVEFFPAFIGAIAHGSAAAPLNPELRGEILERGLTKP
ncbi:AMP-binding protein [Conexibacter sp. DBS9H8]|uniref:AMP-binding protein n=1 Tax=Conexibacter sp. DBS9H8 TaxID=2937801 RepID=UPI0020108C74|nr:AMP-binding protein [Conexibacter sp. DBS9H8]